MLEGDRPAVQDGLVAALRGEALRDRVLRLQSELEGARLRAAIDPGIEARIARRAVAARVARADVDARVAVVVATGEHEDAGHCKEEGSSSVHGVLGNVIEWFVGLHHEPFSGRSRLLQLHCIYATILLR